MINLKQMQQCTTALDTFDSEQDLVDSFINSLRGCRSPWGDVKFSTEFFFQSGRTDVLIVTPEGELIAVEAKLDKWKQAAHQAYRNTSFANQSYVLVPSKTARLAQKNEREFEIRKVGLVSIEGGKIQILRPAERLEPLQTYLHEKAVGVTLA